MSTHHADTSRPNPSAPLALLGGTFEPPHIGHLVLAECARLQFNAQTVLFLPAGDPYKKSGSTGLPSANSQSPTAAADRLAMVRLALANNPHFAVDDRELRRPGPSFTVDTLEELHSEGHPNLILILGADALADLPTWKHPARIAELATIAVAPKPWQPAESQRASPVGSGEGSGVRAPSHELLQMPPLALSSTLIRGRVAASQTIRYLVPDAVIAYIATQRLYTK